MSQCLASGQPPADNTSGWAPGTPGKCSLHRWPRFYQLRKDGRLPVHTGGRGEGFGQLPYAGVACLLADKPERYPAGSPGASAHVKLIPVAEDNTLYVSVRGAPWRLEK